MATSLINTECKRYGCMKNLLACYANCRYSTRCDDLKNEIIDKSDQAANDINAYLSARGRPPVTIQILKRGLKFADVADAKKVISARSHHVEPEIEVNSSPRLKRSLTVRTESRPATAKSKRKHARKPVTLGSVPAPALSKNTLLKNTLLKNKRAAKKQSEAREGSSLAKRTLPALRSKRGKSIAMVKRIKNESIGSSTERESFSSLSSVAAESAASKKSKAPHARRQKRNGGSPRGR